MKDEDKPPEMLSRMELGKALDQLRVRKTDLSLRALAAKTRINRQKVNEIVKGIRAPYPNELQLWLWACDTTFGDFFNEPNPENPYSPRFKKYHDDLEFILKTVGPKKSATVQTLQKECELEEFRNRENSERHERGSPNPA